MSFTFFALHPSAWSEPARNPNSNIERFVELGVNGRGETVAWMQPPESHICTRYNEVFCRETGKIRLRAYTRDELNDSAQNLRINKNLDRDYARRQLESFEFALERLGMPMVPARPDTPQEEPARIVAFG